MLACMLLCVGTAMAQITKVTGKVTEANGEPVIGTTVFVKWSTVGTYTKGRWNFCFR